MMGQNSSSPPPSGCVVEVWANTPHRLCNKHPKKQVEIDVVLGKGDESGKFRSA